MAKIGSSDLEYVRPYLYKKQEEALFHTKRWGVVEASTKAGKSVGCLAWLLEQAIHGKPGNNYWWVAPIFRQAKIMFNRLQNMLPRNLFTANKTDSTIKLINGTTLWFLGAENPDSLYGEDVYAAVIDEASRVRHESAIAVFSTLTATGGPVRIIGNVKGRRNWFYMLARKAEAGEPDHHFARITAADAVAAGVLDETVVSQIRSNMPEEQAAQLFDAVASDDEGNPFGLVAIQRCIVEVPSEATPFVFGWDFAKSKDWTVGIGLDEQQYLCRFHRWNKHLLPPGWPHGAEYWDGTLSLVHKLSAGASAMCDSTGLGDPLIERLQKIGPYVGKKFTQQSKQQLMEGLAVAIQKQEVRFPRNPVLVAELEAFEYQITRTGVLYAAPDGFHDDTVCALALAVAQFKEGQAMSWMDEEVDEDPEWYMSDRYAEEPDAADDDILVA